jgi:hypothetical protein
LALTVVYAGERRPSLVCVQEQYVLVTNIFDRNAVVFWACGLIEFFSIVLHVITAAYKFDFKLVKNKTTNKW